MTPPTIVATGVDYSGGIPGGAAIAADGYTFACRYVFDGSPSLPYKLLTAAEADDLWANGVDPVSNYESTGADALDGYAQGVADAQEAQANHAAAGGPAGRPIYFSLDWDEAQSQDAAVFVYFQGVASVIGLDRTGVYGGYWICSRLLAAGLVTWVWQTEAWSGDPDGSPPDGFDGDYLVSGCNILQRNALGYADINGVECDIDVSLTADYGQWHYSGGTVTQPSEDDTILATVQDNQTQLRGPALNGWPQLNGHTLVDALAAIGQKLGIDGFSPPS